METFCGFCAFFRPIFVLKSVNCFSAFTKDAKFLLFFFASFAPLRETFLVPASPG